MLEDVFKAVDDYIKERVGFEDDILVKVRESSRFSTMPDANISPNQGKFLQILAKACNSSNILEIGTLVGYSTIWLARALQEGGKLITIESEEINYHLACKNIKEANFHGVVTIKKGKALDILPKIFENQTFAFDFIFIDADKPPYLEYLKWAIKMARKGSIIVLDNVIRNAQILEPNSTDPKVIGVKRLNDYLKNCKEADFTILQMVGEKEYDGMAIGIVK